MRDAVFLAHYGVKGMKWGVRRYQKKDGTLTNAGRVRYSNASKPISLNSTTYKEHLKLIDSGRDFVMSKSDKVYRISNSPQEERGRLYVTGHKKDAAAYYNMEYTSGTTDKPVYAAKYDLKKDMKVAGLRTGYKELAKAYGDKEFAKQITAKSNLYQVHKELGRRGYDSDILLKDTPVRSKYIDALSKKGYDAVIDMVDASIGASYTPMVILDSSKSVKEKDRLKIFDHGYIYDNIRKFES